MGCLNYCYLALLWYWMPGLLLTSITATWHYWYLPLLLPAITATWHYCGIGCLNYCYLTLQLPDITATWHYCYLPLLLPAITATCHYCFMPLLLPGITVIWVPCPPCWSTHLLVTVCKYHLHVETRGAILIWLWMLHAVQSDNAIWNMLLVCVQFVRCGLLKWTTPNNRGRYWQHIPHWTPTRLHSQSKSCLPKSYGQVRQRNKHCKLVHTVPRPQYVHYYHLAL